MSDVFAHPWLGGLFNDEGAAQIWAADRQLTHMLGFEAALTLALGQSGRISVETAQTVAAQIDSFELDRDDLRTGTARDGIPVPALVAQLKAAIKPSEDAIHTGATSQDVMDTALSLTLKDFNALLGEKLDTLSAALKDVTDEFGDHTIMGRTRMQAAYPIKASTRLATWSGPISTYREKLKALAPQVEVLQLGGPVGDRAGFGEAADAIAQDMARQLELNNPERPWHAKREALVEYAGLLSMISGSLGKMGQDLCLMSQQGVDDLALSGGGGSSAMAHKQNPILAELLVTLGRFNATQVSGMHHALAHEQERSGAAWALEWMILPQMAQTTGRALAAAHQLVGEIKRIGTAKR